MASKNLQSSNLWIAKGLLDKINWILVVSSSRIGAVSTKLSISYARIWIFYQEKLVILGVSMGCDQATKVTRGEKNESDEMENLPAVTHFTKETIKVAHFNARATEMCRTLCKIFGEGEEDFMPMVSMQTVLLTFC